MRILIKGGVWKNTEDEILKAAVMKYGKNQWARVASLLNRKSAKQCKARWYEWLDPSIKKIEWSREEEEKLLHLAKLMPNQWRTIAPIVGRTAGQCMEHYEKLLDEAQEGVVEGGEQTDDPRKLRPGEIDPAPETKPARPDPIDMDEDEKEMLAEARARLANTKGKKAKRKARERQLDESKRLAMLQKRRELKAAGIESKLGQRKRKYIDYAREIPFQKLTPAGFYDVSEENAIGKTKKLDPVKDGMELAKMEGRHEREEEERERNKDKKRLKMLFKQNAEQAILQISKASDPSTMRRRTALNLPAPQVSDGELEEIVKIGNSLMLPPTGGGVGSSTQALIGDYTAAYRPSSTPLRTPMQENIVLQEAKNLRALREMTPLLGEELPELYEGTGFAGITPRAGQLATPNTVLATPGRGATPSALSVMGTPLSRAGGSVSQSSSAGLSQTPLRDHFGLNEPSPSMDPSFSSDSGSVASFSTRESRLREKSAKSQLIGKLRSLPEPEYTYEISVPELEGGNDEDDDPMSKRPEDAAEVAERHERLLREEEERELSRRSSVLRRGLPRPPSRSLSIEGGDSHGHGQGHVLSSLSKPAVPSSQGEDLSTASGLVSQEMLLLLLHDDAKFPHAASSYQQPSSSKKDAGRRPRQVHLEPFTDDEIQMARELVDEEMGSNSTERMTPEAFALAWEEAYKSEVFLPAKESFGVPANKAELLASLAHQFDAIKAKIDKDAKKAGKLEQKLQVTHQGYLNRSGKLGENLRQVFSQLDSALIELHCFSTLREAEQRSLPNRLKKLREEKERAEAAEAAMQEKFAGLKKVIATRQVVEASN